MAHDLSLPDRLTFLLVLGILATAAIAFWNLLWVVVLSASLAIVIMPVKHYLGRSMREGTAALLTTAAVFFATIFSVGFTIAVLAQNGDYLTQIVQGILAWIASAETGGAAAGIASTDIAAWTDEQIASFGDWVTGLASQVPMLIIDLIVFFLSLYMFIYRGDALAAEVTAALPSRLRAAVEKLTRTSVDTLYALYIVHVATSVVTFVLAIPFFYVLGYDHIVFYALMAAIFQLIPIIGPSVIMLFLGVYSLSLGDIRGGLLVAFVGYPIVCALPDIYFRPMMMGRRASIHPVIMWIGFFGGLAVMGIVGFVLGPLFLALAITGYHILLEEMKEVKEAAQGT
jgi:predicted PurR-regulated permease PerM